jgi:hypothetical protein
MAAIEAAPAFNPVTNVRRPVEVEGFLLMGLLRKS